MGSSCTSRSVLPTRDGWKGVTSRRDNASVQTVSMERAARMREGTHSRRMSERRSSSAARSSMDVYFPKLVSGDMMGTSLRVYEHAPWRDHALLADVSKFSSECAEESVLLGRCRRVFEQSCLWLVVAGVLAGWRDVGKSFHEEQLTVQVKRRCVNAASCETCCPLANLVIARWMCGTTYSTCRRLDVDGIGRR